MGAEGPWKGVCGALPSSHAHAGHHSADGPACGTSIDLQPSRALSAFCLVACCHRAGRADGAGPGQLTFPQAPPSGISSGLGKPDGCMDTGTRTSQARIRAVGLPVPTGWLGVLFRLPRNGFRMSDSWARLPCSVYILEILSWCPFPLKP